MSGKSTENCGNHLQDGSQSRIVGFAVHIIFIVKAPQMNDVVVRHHNGFFVHEEELCINRVVIDRATGFCSGKHCFVRIQQKFKKLTVSHVVVLDFKVSAALVVDVVRQVGDDQARLLSVHEFCNDHRIGAIAADEAVRA